MLVGGAEALETLEAEWDALETLEAEWDAELTLETDVGLEPPPGTAVGTVEGWRAVFHVAVVGQGVVVTVGDVVA